MSSTEHLEYFRLRAEVERQLAAKAGDTIAGQIHRELAERYEAAAERLEHGPQLSIVSSAA